MQKGEIRRRKKKEWVHKGGDRRYTRFRKADITACRRVHRIPFMDTPYQVIRPFLFSNTYIYSLDIM